MKSLSDIDRMLKQAKDLVEDAQRALGAEHALLGDKELSQVVSRIDRVRAQLKKQRSV